MEETRHEALATLLTAQRKKAGLSQKCVAKRLREHQSWVSRAESGTRPISVIDLLNLGKAIGFDPAELVGELVNHKKVKG
jgi:transcriptional regulator with XRE-family HTH domain